MASAVARRIARPMVQMISRPSCVLKSTSAQTHLRCLGAAHRPILSPAKLEIIPSRCMQSTGDKELLDFLADEIVAETKQGKMDKLPSRIGDFDIKLDQAEVTLTRKHNNETVTVTLNVNHSVDSDPEAEDLSETQGSEQLKARPTFNVDITKGNRTVSFTCSYTEGGVVEQQGEQYKRSVAEGEYQSLPYDAVTPGSCGWRNRDDTFSIDEVVMFEGEHHEKNFSVSGEILDGVLYDLLMNMLEERGVSNDFAGKLSDFCTEYEHKCYIALLEGLRGFVSK
ncbi:complement component 1 Q subcomponent-binding protein, mitochondrial-like isoform X1 [Amphibalanus amphitrite]|uniref:complement component 1 Q subcomponent-binding protein, mitochondrial-like isoform X1 n=1 Tax=Amphibalanus amphitrite TaxID=1232801 RepID=UPI001C92090F|nr:complement component 1 Q subcomponent-binding protein, mitochondrial-like isoform X1 [Amphibalanus amphitrite]